ncbi:DNA/RNA-binding protein KIN17 [Melia azedarach]|uniref:DNA/RNA-binding protein KIN17 n=1 Tax=Melia azedarach TaxID=155640 RepID=A0ACC1XGL3_MELAZ|nr:DNA/RNA-binding protein KIN17 [Melia azedarach]
MGQKQCRDENGFKCHSMSESHQRQMKIFGQNPDRIVEGFSEEFESGFLELMKRSHRFSRVAATVVYNEYIHHRHHVHMNSTKWATLTEFVKYLGRPGKCKVGFSLGSSSLSNKENGTDTAGSRLVFGELENNTRKGKINKNGKTSGKSALDELMREEEKVKEKMNRKDYWLCEGIIVKVMSKALADKGYYKQKGVVKKVIDKYVGEIEMLGNKHKLRVDQDELETVIPQIGEDSERCIQGFNCKIAGSGC